MYHLIANPASRSGRDALTCSQLQALLTQKGCAWRLYRTDGPGDARGLAEAITAGHLPEAAASFEAGRGTDTPALIVLGGDGTVNEVINGIADFSAVQVGIVPVGSSNDFARGLGLPSDPEASIRRLAEGRVRRIIDLGRVTYHRTSDVRSRLYDPRQESASSDSLQRLFCVSAGIGYDASICEEALSSHLKDVLNRFHLGKVTYGLIGIRQLFTNPRVRADVELDDGRRFHTDQMLFSAAMNEPYEGGGYRFAPDASDTDGLLTMLVIGDISIPKALLSFPAAHAGRYYTIRGVHHFAARRMRIRTSAPLWVHTDGEVMLQADDITLECLPGRLPLLV